MSEEKQGGVRYCWNENTNEIRKFNCVVYTDKRSDGSPYIYRFRSTEELGRSWWCYAKLIGTVVRNNSIFFLEDTDENEKFIRELFRIHFNIQACKLRKEADAVEKKADSILTATIVCNVKEV